ncbi:uncharacterized protein [Ptychodera flava]|uniref:uncharacterized protein isoform X2 n=1 Tax=Ptychodera flava TaxID=63121 RepID=UPI003969D7BD
MLDILMSSSADVGQIIVTLIKDFIMTSTIAEGVLVKIANSLTEMLQKLLLHPQPDKGQLKLLLPLLCQVHLKSSPHIPSNVINLKLLYHVCKLFTRSYSEDIEVQFHALNYLNLTLIQAAGQTDNPVLSMVLSNNHLFTLLEDWSKLDCLPGYLSTTLTTIALLVHLFHKHKTQVDYRIAFDVQYLVSLVSGKHTALVQASALHLWSVVLSTKFSSNFVTFKLGSERSLLSDRDVNLAIPTRHLQQLYILAQNVIVVQDNEVLQCHAVSCLCHLLMYSKQDHNFRNHLVHQPWNVRLLELSLDWCVHKNTLPLSALYLLYTLHAFPGISNTMKLNYREKILSMLEEVTARESTLPTLYIDNVMLPSFLSHDTVWYDDIKTTADKLTSLLRLDD